MNDNEKLVQRWISFYRFYQNFKTIESLICIEKGGIPLERYAGRYFGADVLEYLVKLGAFLLKVKDVDNLFIKCLGDKFSFRTEMKKLEKEFSAVMDLVSISEKPIHKMTLEEFAKSFNVELERK